MESYTFVRYAIYRHIAWNQHVLRFSEKIIIVASKT